MFLIWSIRTDFEIPTADICELYMWTPKVYTSQNEWLTVNPFRRIIKIRMDTS